MSAVIESQPNILRRRPLSFLAGGTIVLIAGAALLALEILSGLYEKASRLSAAKSAIDQGAYISQWLAENPYFSENRGEKEEAAGFDRMVQWLQKMEKGVQYVALSDNDVVLYQRQFTDNSQQTALPSSGQTAVRRQKLVLGTNILPIITFTRTLTTLDGHKRKLEVALNKEIIDRQGAHASAALNRMFYLSFAVVCAAFVVCLLAISALVHREMIWQKHSRLNEHLAFAGAVAGSVLHDFRNPLSAMRLDAQLLQAETAKKTGGRPEHLAELSERIVKTIDRIDALLAEFLALSRPAGSAPELFEVNAHIQDCVELLRLRFEKSCVKLAVNLGRPPLQVRGFPAQFKRAILNILTNAEQASPPAGRVFVETAVENNQALINITDEGPGVPPDERAKIFSLFYSNRPGGTGIGLALAKTAIKNCGGEIAVETPASGKGTAFVIRIPLAKT